MENTERHDEPTEETRLLAALGHPEAVVESSSKHNESRNPLDLPWRQLLVVSFIQCCGSITAESIYPYLTQLVSELDIIGGDKGNIGYYVGLINSFYYVALALTVLHWNRLSDHIGRKPILLIGLAGSMTSILCIGLSRTYWGLVFSRSLWGLLDGNFGIIKSVLGEVTESNNRASGFAFTFVLWAIGGSIGPWIGGSLARPSDRFPALFGGQFWKQYPYFLPCLCVAVIVAVCFATTLLFFNETVSKPTLRSCYQTPKDAPLLLSNDEPLPLRELFTYPLIVAIANYFALELLSTSHSALFPLFLAMPVELGGAGLEPVHIGYIMGGHRAFAALIMGTCFAPLSYRFGERRVFILAMSSFLILWILYPITNSCARHFGMSTSVWIGIIFMSLPNACSNVATASILICIVGATPNKRSLGTTSGLAQTVVTGARIAAPALSTALFSVSIKKNLLGGHAVYAILFVTSFVAVALARKLPRRTKPAWEEPAEDGIGGE